MQRERAFFPLLDAIRGAAALIVVLYHIPGFVGFEIPHGYLAVDLFFVLSGVVVTNAYERRLLAGMTFWQFAQVRLLRLYPLYFVGLVLGVLASLVIGNPYLSGMGLPLAIVFGVLMLPRLWPLRFDGNFHLNIYPLNGPSWSLFFELGVNFIYAAAIRHLTTRIVAAIAVFSGLLMVVAVLRTGSHSLNIGLIPRQIPLGFVRTIFSFSVGVLLYRNIGAIGQLTTLLPRIPSTIVILLLVSLILLFGPLKEGDAYYDLVAAILLFPILVGCSLHFSYSRRITQLFAFCGMASYSIYILHFPIYQLARAVTAATATPLVVPFYGVLLVLVVVALSYVLDRYYDGPIRRKLRGPSKHREELGGSAP